MAKIARKESIGWEWFANCDESHPQRKTIGKKAEWRDPSKRKGRKPDALRGSRSESSAYFYPIAIAISLFLVLLLYRLFYSFSLYLPLVYRIAVYQQSALLSIRRVLFIETVVIFVWYSERIAEPKAHRCSKMVIIILEVRHTVSPKLCKCIAKSFCNPLLYVISLCLLILYGFLQPLYLRV